jgi:hypothetical protein
VLLADGLVLVEHDLPGVVIGNLVTDCNCDHGILLEIM